MCAANPTVVPVATALYGTMECSTVGALCAKGVNGMAWRGESRLSCSPQAATYQSGAGSALFMLCLGRTTRCWTDGGNSQPANASCVRVPAPAPRVLAASAVATLAVCSYVVGRLGNSSGGRQSPTTDVVSAAAILQCQARILRTPHQQQPRDAHLWLAGCQ